MPTSPTGRSSCEKTMLVSQIPAEPEWRLDCIGVCLSVCLTNACYEETDDEADGSLGVANDDDEKIDGAGRCKVFEVGTSVATAGR